TRRSSDLRYKNLLSVVCCRLLPVKAALNEVTNSKRTARWTKKSCAINLGETTAHLGRASLGRHCSPLLFAAHFCSFAHQKKSSSLNRKERLLLYSTPLTIMGANTEDAIINAKALTADRTISARATG